MLGNSNIDNTTNRPTTRLPDVLNEDKVKKYVYDFYRKEGKENYAKVAMNRWRKGSHYPSMDMIVRITKIMNSNISFILGTTDVDIPCEFIDPPIKRNLSDLLSIRDMSISDLVSSLNGNYRSVHLYEKELPINRVSSLIRLSNAVRLSADYILGYTEWETWEMYSSLGHPFAGLKPGDSAYIVADKSARSRAAIEAAINRGDGQNCLITSDGEHVLFPNGNKYSINDSMFVGNYIAINRPEVK